MVQCVCHLNKNVPGKMIPLTTGGAVISEMSHLEGEEQTLLRRLWLLFPTPERRGRCVRRILERRPSHGCVLIIAHIKCCMTFCKIAEDDARNQIVL